MGKNHASSPTDTLPLSRRLHSSQKRHFKRQRYAGLRNTERFGYKYNLSKKGFKILSLMS